MSAYEALVVMLMVLTVTVTLLIALINNTKK